ncbi:MAG: SET domain-containing protein-lysine N-methyltransferase [Planctomycetaceae bacterium]|nr:SET domain-containing protein-lysine N-methyltransferase [Planctomycetaceae bacterium]
MTDVTIAPAQYGLGLFAARNLSMGEQVGWMEGFLLRDSQYSSDYAVDLGDDYCLEPDGTFRYLNHSCEPNCELYLIEETEELGPLLIPRVSVEAIREITIGEQLTIDYGWPADAAIPCGCGSKKCRGWVVSADQLHLLDNPKRSRKTAI